MKKIEKIKEFLEGAENGFQVNVVSDMVSYNVDYDKGDYLIVEDLLTLSSGSVCEQRTLMIDAVHVDTLDIKEDSLHMTSKNDIKIQILRF